MSLEELEKIIRDLYGRVANEEVLKILGELIDLLVKLKREI